MNQCALDAVMTKEQQQESIQALKEAKSGTQFSVGLDDGKFNLVQTFFFQAKQPYILKIQGNTACWTKG